MSEASSFALVEEFLDAPRFCNRVLKTARVLTYLVQTTTALAIDSDHAPFCHRAATETHKGY